MNEARKLVLREITQASEAFKLLNGYFCLYKPRNKGFKKTVNGLKTKIVHDLNSMEYLPPRERVVIEGSIQKDLNVRIMTNLADHVLVSGERYKNEYIPLSLENNPGWKGSGVVVGCIGPNIRHLQREFGKYSFPKIYQLKGQFGFATNNFMNEGKIVVKSSYKHLKKEHFHEVLCKIEAAQRQHMFKVAGVGLETEDAYKIAVRGWVPPANKKTTPVIFAVRGTKFDLPNFTVEIQCMNECEAFLGEFINEIGLAMKSTAMCTGIRLTHYGPFSYENSLLYECFNLENLIQNIYLSTEMFKKYQESTRLLVV